MATGTDLRARDGVRAKKAAGMPVLIQPSGTSALLDKINLDKNGYNEAWLQRLAFDHPQVLPILDIEPGFAEIYPVAMEVPCAHGYIDNLYITATGDLVLVEVKLWRNPQARREVVAQALDYVAALMAMSYEAFEIACRKGQGMAAAGLYDLMAGKADALEQHDFIGAVSRNLKRGRMLVIALGDGIRAEAELLAELLQSHAGAHFTFALVELATWQNPATGDIIALPSTLARTVMITRGIVAVDDGVAVVRPLPAGCRNARISTFDRWEISTVGTVAKPSLRAASTRAWPSMISPSQTRTGCVKPNVAIDSIRRSICSGVVRRVRCGEGRRSSIGTWRISSSGRRSFFQAFDPGSAWSRSAARCSLRLLVLSSFAFLNLPSRFNRLSTLMLDSNNKKPRHRCSGTGVLQRNQTRPRRQRKPSRQGSFLGQGPSCDAPVSRAAVSNNPIINPQVGSGCKPVFRGFPQPPNRWSSFRAPVQN